MRVLPVEVVEVAVGERAADAEVAHQLVIHAEHDFLRPRRGVVADLVDRRQPGRIERVEAVVADVAEAEEDLVGIGDLVPFVSTA
jgi:hypothetical protein